MPGKKIRTITKAACLRVPVLTFNARVVFVGEVIAWRTQAPAFETLRVVRCAGRVGGTDLL